MKVKIYLKVGDTDLKVDLETARKLYEVLRRLFERAEAAPVIVKVNEWPGPTRRIRQWYEDDTDNSGIPIVNVTWVSS